MKDLKQKRADLDAQIATIQQQFAECQQRAADLNEEYQRALGALSLLNELENNDAT